MSGGRRSDRERFNALRHELADTLPVRRGSVVRRFMPCGKPGCRCQGKSPKLHGPYYQWTRKVDGRTTTKRINQAQAKLIRGWIQNGRRLDRLIKQLEAVSLRLTEAELRSAEGE